MLKHLSTALAPFVLLIGAMSGCANVNTVRTPPVTITAYASAKSPFFKGREEAAARDVQVRQIGMNYLYSYPHMSVRECNNDMTACSWGIVKLTSRIILQKVVENYATVSVSLTYDLERSQVTSDKNMFLRDEIPADIPVLSGNAHFEKVVTLPFGEMRRVSFDHGVDFDICAAPADQYMEPANGLCSVDDIMLGKISQASIPSL